MGSDCSWRGFLLGWCYKFDGDYTETNWTVHFKWENYILIKVFLKNSIERRIPRLQDYLQTDALRACENKGWDKMAKLNRRTKLYAENIIGAKHW